MKILLNFPSKNTINFTRKKIRPTVSSQDTKLSALLAKFEFCRGLTVRLHRPSLISFYVMSRI